MTNFEEVLLDETRNINKNLQEVRSEVSELRKDLAVQNERHEHTKAMISSLSDRLLTTEQQCSACPARLQHNSWSKVLKDLTFSLAIGSAIISIIFQLWKQK